MAIPGWYKKSRISFITPGPLQGYTVQAGHLLMLSPYWSHRNPDKFPQPEKFQPVRCFLTFEFPCVSYSHSIQDRWLECDVEKAQLLDGFVGFGGGRYQCPGRWFALMEMHLLVAMILQQFTLELLHPLPSPVSYTSIHTLYNYIGGNFRFFFFFS